MWSQIKRIAIQACKKVFFIYKKMDIPQHFHSQLFLTSFEVIYSVKYFLVCTWIYTAKLVHTLFKNIFYILLFNFEILYCKLNKSYFESKTNIKSLCRAEFRSVSTQNNGQIVKRFLRCFIASFPQK